MPLVGVCCYHTSTYNETVFFLSTFDLAPNSVLRLQCNYFSGGYGLAVVWEPPSGVVNVVQVDVAGKSFNQSESRQEVKGLQVAQWYKVTATSFSGNMKSPAVSANCQTDPAGKITWKKSPDASS